MHPVHEQLMEHVITERSRLVSRRRVLAGGAGLLIAGAWPVADPGRFRSASVVARAKSSFKSDVDVLNYALALEHLEHALYRDGVGQFALGVDGYGVDIAGRLTAIRQHEQAHVKTLTQVITGLGGEPAAEAAYDFGYTDAASFLMTAAAVENIGVMAYDGAGQYLKDAGLLTAAGSIVAIEARHAAYLNLITGSEPIPAAFEEAKEASDIQKLTSRYVKSA
jgi:hypothetical protein